MKKGVSVIIPTYNSSSLIRRCIDSVLSQHYNDILEVIVIDDGSTDDTRDVINKYYADKVQYIYQDNRGVSAARNTGIALATCEYLAFLDADDYWKQGFLSRTSQFLNREISCVAVSVSQRHVSVSGVAILPLNSPKQEIIVDDFYDYWFNHNHVCTGSVLLRTNVVKSFGGFREDLAVCEDLELWALVARYGQWGVIPEVLFVSDGNIVTRAKGWRNKMMRRWLSAPDMQDWERRIVAAFSEGISESYFKARARVSLILCYCHIQSFRDDSARKMLKDNLENMSSSVKVRIICFLSKSALTWKLWCIFARFWERRRKING